MTTDVAGLQLARAAYDVLVAAGQLETADGYACMLRVRARARPLKLTDARWLVQVNQQFLVVDFATPPVIAPP